MMEMKEEPEELEIEQPRLVEMDDDEFINQFNMNDFLINGE